jgi:hypothetical protein
LEVRDSGVIALNLTSETTEVSAKSNRRKSLLRAFQSISSMFSELLACGLFPIFPLVKIGEVGASYHVGGVKDGGGRVLSDLGQTDVDSNIYVVDSAGHYGTKPGPSTAINMARSAIIATRVVRYLRQG